MAGVKHRLDLFGVLVLSFAAGNAGGITRDLLIGAMPPAAISDWRYLGVSLVAGLVTFCVRTDHQPAAQPGAGASTPPGWRSSPSPARRRRSPTDSTRSWRRCSACSPGIGGGMLRDVLVAEVPTVLRGELYAVAALAGAAVVVVGHVLASADSRCARRRGALLRTPRICDPARLAAPPRFSPGAITGGCSISRSLEEALICPRLPRARAGG